MTLDPVAPGTAPLMSKVVLSIDPNHLEALSGLAFRPHLTGHLLTLEHSARV